MVARGGASGKWGAAAISTSEPAPFARVDHARIPRDAGPRLQPGVDDPERAERDHADRRPPHLARVNRPEREKEAEDQQDAEREDPEQVTGGAERAPEALQHRNPLPQRLRADRSDR